MLSLLLTGLALAQDPAPEAPSAEEAPPAEDAPPAEAPPPTTPSEGVPPSFGPGDGWGEPPRPGDGRRVTFLGSPMACGVAAGCGGCCVGVAFTPFTVPVGLGVMASAPITFAMVSPSGERYPDASEMSWAQAEERRRAMRASGVGVAIGAGIGGATVTGLLLLTVLALSGATWTGPL
ncbi:hypothetical protein L6R49_17730 [Myxococcota bacterium]|nr:hypothetical protein [Myxococcota bacterium]